MTETERIAELEAQIKETNDNIITERLETTQALSDSKRDNDVLLDLLKDKKLNGNKYEQVLKDINSDIRDFELIDGQSSGVVIFNCSNLITIINSRVEGYE